MYPKEYIDYLVHFHGDRDYFECHEILEEYWKQSTDGKKDSIWVGFILLAVSAYHHRRTNDKGAKRTLEKAIHIFSLKDTELDQLGLDKQQLFPLLKQQLSALEKGQSYQSFQLPISDVTLRNLCQAACEKKGFEWGTNSDLKDVNLIHRHKLRDRSDVIEARLTSLKNKKGNN
nr:DUF309 domain-containing protein [Neobacillus sp. Marseille-Q6967]